MRISFSLALALAAFSGFVALGYEIAWARVYAFASASRPVAFGCMLGSYLLGLALGSLLSRRWQDQGVAREVALRNLSRLLALSAVVSFLVIPAVSWGVVFSHWFLTLPAVALASTLLGTLLPLICHVAIAPDTGAGTRMSYVYIANIIGSGAGSLVTGFVLFEHLSLGSISQTLLVLSLLLSVCVRQAAGRQGTRGLTLLAAGTVLALAAPFLHEGLYERLQLRDEYLTKPRFEMVVETRRGVTVVDTEQNIYGGGIYDGRIDLDPETGGGVIRPFIISALHSAPKDILVIGVSGGAWTQILAHHPQVERLTAVEIDAGYLHVIAAYPEVSSLLHNPKVEIVIDDGRRWLRRNTDRKFDAIVMNTTFHWREFASALLGREFLELAARHLKPDGIALWNCTGSSRAIATGLDVFPHAMMVSNNFVGSLSPLSLDIERWRSVLSGYRIDGRLVFDPETQKGRKDLESMIAGGMLDSPTRVITLRPTLVANHGHATIITDDNLGEEYSFDLARNLFLQKLLGR